MLALSNSELKQTLDTIDKVRSSLSGLQSSTDQGFYEELLSSLPQFVACGPQSAGKSSVIRRISGVPLPEASTLCTRIATLIQMRRDSEESIRVCLLGPGGDVISDENYDGPEKVREAVSRAQKTALARSYGKRFADDHTVQVQVRGPDKHNVTLVDLPGFHTDDDEDTKTVNEMVKRYIEMPGTLALHVIKGDQDYASLLGNDFMRQARKHDNARVTVLTHCDNLKQSVEKDVKRLQMTLDKTSEHSSLTIAVLGSAANHEQETEQLGHLSDMDARLEVGTAPLAKHLEERMCQHLETQYPKAVGKLHESLTATLERLEKVKEQTPMQALYHMADTMRENWRRERPIFMNKLRETLHKMSFDIKGFKIRNLSTGIEPVERLRDTFDEPLEEGQWVGVKLDPEDNKVSGVIISSIGLEDVSWCQEKTDGHEEPKTGTTIFEDLYSEESLDSSCIINDIKQLAVDRGMRNFVHLDRQPIIARYSQEFAKHYTSKLRQTKQIIHNNLTILFDSVFDKGVPEMSQLAAKRLRQQMRKHLEEAQAKANDAICAIESHNTQPDLIFTTNEHYLNSEIQKLVAADADMATDDGGCRHIYHDVRAFIKVQRKQVSELGSKELIRTMVLESEARFLNLLAKELAIHAELIKEPHRVIRERESLRKRKAVLEGALRLVK